ncbi:transposase [Bacillus pacificus]
MCVRSQAFHVLDTIIIFLAISQSRREKRIHQDEIGKEIILKAFRFKNRKKGARQIKMTLAGQFQVVYNLKRIRRIMKKIWDNLSYS